MRKRQRKKDFKKSIDMASRIEVFSKRLIICKIEPDELNEQAINTACHLMVAFLNWDSDQEERCQSLIEKAIGFINYYDKQINDNGLPDNSLLQEGCNILNFCLELDNTKNDVVFEKIEAFLKRVVIRRTGTNEGK